MTSTVPTALEHPKDHFLRLMLYLPTGVTAAQQPFDHAHHAQRAFSPLRQSPSQGGFSFRLQQLSELVRVQLGSPATEVMTDLRRSGAVTASPGTAVDEAHAAMITRKVRALFVIDETRLVLGMLTATDILGERPIKCAQQRGIHHHEVLVRDIMTPADSLELLELNEVQRARVGDIVETLKGVLRQHALVLETDQQARWLRGIFSLTQIARQLGVTPPPDHDLPRTFAEIEAMATS